MLRCRSAAGLNYRVTTRRIPAREGHRLLQRHYQYGCWPHDCADLNSDPIVCWRSSKWTGRTFARRLTDGLSSMTVTHRHPGSRQERSNGRRLHDAAHRQRAAFWRDLKHPGVPALVLAFVRLDDRWFRSTLSGRFCSGMRGESRCWELSQSPLVGTAARTSLHAGGHSRFFERSSRSLRSS
jgi:hypothetical protein